MTKAALALIATVASILFAASISVAQTEFYQGKTIRIVDR
jgi:hypothetical protein